MPLTLNAITDIITATLFDEKSGKLSDITPERLRNHVAARRLIPKATENEQGGKAIRFDANINYGANEANWVAPYTVEQVAVGDSIIQGKDEIRFVNTKFGMDQMEETWNQGKYAIIKVIRNREQNAKIKLVRKIENQFWGETAYANRNLEMNGILNLLPYCSGTGDFVGTYASGWSSVHDIDPTTYTGWKSYGGAYAAVTQDDVIQKLKLAWAKTNFEAPLDAMLIGDYKQKAMNSYGLYMNLVTRMAFDSQLRLQNDSLGADVAYEDGRSTFKGQPLTDVAVLDSNTRNPIFGINWDLLTVYSITGWNNYPIVMKGANQPTVVNTFIYKAIQMITEDRRQLGFNFALAA